jgi:hypothetical protein
MRINRTPTVNEFLDAIADLDSISGDTARQQLFTIAKCLDTFDKMHVEAIKITIIKPEPQVFGLLGLPYEGSQLKEFSFPLLRERYQGQIEDSVMVRVIFVW